MKKYLLLLLTIISGSLYAQSNILSVNSGGIIASNSVLTIGEIVVNPVTANLSSGSGIIGILAQVNQQTLEVNQFELTSNVRVFPNPTISKLYFEGNQNIQNQEISVFNQAGQLVYQSKIDKDQSLNLEAIASGIYLISFTDKSIKSFKIIKR